MSKKRNEEIKLFGYITMPENVRITLEDYLDGKIQTFVNKGKRIEIGKVITNDSDLPITEKVIGVSCYVEKGKVSPNKFWVYTEKNKKYLISFPIK
jgi:hypothetical protein